MLHISLPLLFFTRFLVVTKADFRQLAKRKPHSPDVNLIELSNLTYCSFGAL